jgi:hypothetical protein
MRAARASKSYEDSSDTGLIFQEEDVDYISQQNATYGQVDFENKNQSRISWADNTMPSTTGMFHQQQLEQQQKQKQRKQQKQDPQYDKTTNKVLAEEYADGVFGRRTSGSHIMKNPIIENIFDEKREPLTAPIIINRLKQYLPRAVIGGNKCELHLALGFECDLDESYWSHYSIRHDHNRYNQLRQDIESQVHQEFNGGGSFPNGGSPPPTIVFYERPPPARLGSFEIMLSISDKHGGIQHILLHTKLGSSHFPSIKNVVQRIHNIIGSKRAKYHIDPTKQSTKPEVSLTFSKKHQTSFSKNIHHHHNSNNKTTFGFSTLPGFNNHTTNGSAPSNIISETWTTFSGGKDILTSRNKKQICELCGEYNYLKISPVVDRYNNSALGKEHGFREAYNHRIRPSQHHKKSRYQVRMIGDCCLSQCVGCGWSYLDDANHEGACLPWDDAWMPEELMSQWGLTRFSCRHIPQQRYRAHIPLDSRQRRKIYVDVVDLKSMNENIVFVKNPPILELVSETTGEVILLTSMNEKIYINDENNISKLLSAEIVVPDIYSLRVVSSSSSSSSSGYCSGQYIQKNWIHPFEVSYHGPILMTCEIEFDTSVIFEVRDLSGCLLDNATVNLLTPATNIFKDIKDNKNYLENMKNIGDSIISKQMGQIYALGKAPRKMMVDIPKVYQLTSTLWGHAQVDFMQPFKLDYSSWPLYNPQQQQSSFSSPTPLVLSITMVRFDVTFLCTDAFGKPLPHQFQHFKHHHHDTSSASNKKRGWTLTMTEFCSNSTLPLGSYLVHDVTCSNPKDRTVTLSSLKYPDLSNKSKSNENKLIDKYFSINVESGKNFISRMKVGNREVHSGEFKLSVKDWIQAYDDQSKLISNNNLHDDDNYGSSIYSQGNQSLVITIEFGAFDVLVLFRNMRFAAHNKKNQQLEDQQRNQKSPNKKKSLSAVASKLQLLSGSGKQKIGGDLGERFEAPLGTSVALIAVDSSFSTKHDHKNNNSMNPNGQSNSKEMKSFVPRRVELSTSSKTPTTFTPDMLRVLRGKYQISVSSPGFTAVAVRIGGVSVGVNNTHRNTGNNNNNNQKGSSSESGGHVDFTEDLWQRCFNNDDDEAGASSQLLVEVDLEFDPLPLLAPIQIEKPCNFDLTTTHQKVQNNNNTHALQYDEDQVSVDLCFVIDATGSMEPYIQAAAHALDHAERDLKKYYPNIKFRYGCIIYRDLDPKILTKIGKNSKPPIPIEVKKFTNNIDDIEDWLLDIQTSGGGDIPEDLFSGLNHAANEMQWKSDLRFCLVITDAPCHGLRFHDSKIEDSYPEEPDPHGNICEKILKNFRDLHIKFIFGRINSSTDIMIKEFQRIYTSQDNAEKQATQRAKTIIKKEQTNNINKMNKLSRKKKLELLEQQNKQNLVKNNKSLKKLKENDTNNNEDNIENEDDDDEEKELERHHQQIQKDLFRISNKPQSSMSDNNNNNNQSKHISNYNLIQVINLPNVDITNYENTHMKGVELGKQMDIDEAIYEEQILHLRDIIREFLIVNSIHEEIKSKIKLSWSIPAHVLYGSLKVIDYELQYVSLNKPGTLSSALTLEKTRESLRDVSRSIIENNDMFIKPDNFNNNNDNNDNDDIGSIISQKLIESKKNKNNNYDNDNIKHGNQWKSIIIPSCENNSYSLDIPTVLPTVFRIKAICDDGYQTGFSEEQIIYPIVSEKKLNNSIIKNKKLESINKIIIKKSNHIDAITFVFTDGSRHNFTYLSGEKLKYNHHNYNENDDEDDDEESNIHGSKIASSSSSVSSSALAEHQVLELMKSEHLLEVKGINSVTHCEAIEFLTSHGRRARFDCESAYQNPGTTSGFHFISHPGRRIMGLNLRFTNTNDDDGDHHHHIHHHYHADHEEDGRGGGGNILDISHQGFVIDGCSYEDIPYLSPEEHEAALVAASKEEARKIATLTYTTDKDADVGSFIKQNKLIPEGHNENDDDDEYISGRDKAALDRKVAERDAQIANHKYREILIQHAIAKKKESDRIESEKHSKKIISKQVNDTIKSISTKRKIQIYIINNTEKKVRICWIDYRGEEIEYYNLNHEEAKKISTFVGHCWCGRDLLTDEVLFTAQVSKEHGQKIYCGCNT